ncbi:TonB-dependent receptor plug domain-containing protein, partial [Alistipes communis]
LVDGVERDYSQVDPEDVAQLSVLKDASATAVYGVRGANGVILITTKRGSKGAPKFNMNYTFTLQQPTRLPTFLGSYD